jgi:hypothetical protein
MVDLVPEWRNYKRWARTAGWEMHRSGDGIRHDGGKLMLVEGWRVEGEQAKDGNAVSTSPTTFALK